MRRRNFLTLAGLGTVALALPILSTYSSSVQEAMVGIIHNEFHFLKLDPQGVKRFVADYCRLNGLGKQLTMNLKTKTYRLLKVDAEHSNLVRILTHLYLISTDFFQNRMDESREVKYLGLYNPHKTPCANPFSAVYYPPAA